MSPRHWLCSVLLLCCAGAFAQSADQQIVSATDSADPVIPGDNFSYTVVVRNNGPDPATNGGLNINFGSAVTHVSHTVPAGWQCFFNGGNASCITPSFAAGSQATITLVVQMAPHLISFPDGSTTTNFFTSGVTPDPNTANNAQTVTTSWDSPQFDQSIAVVDTPDPVGPDQTISYAIQVTHTGVDDAGSTNVNVSNNGTLRFQSLSAPAGFSCTPLSAGAVPTLTCTKPSLSAGVYNFTLVVLADDAVLGVNDGTVSSVFSVNGVGNETNHANNSETEATAYVTPDADMVVAVGDTPDPALLGTTFEYLVTITNNGPDAATNATMNTFNPGTLRFQMLEAPQAFNCTTPQIGAAPTMSCSIPSLAAGASAEFIITVRSDPAQIGELGGTVATSFSAGNALSDPNGSNNSENESTVLIPVNLFKDSFEF